MPGGPLSAARPATLFTVGYEGRVQPALINLLTSVGVTLLLDVRAVPLSRKAGFSKTTLGSSLRNTGIGYLHDRRLGTPKEGRQAAQRGRIAEMTDIFNAHMATELAQDALADAIALANSQRVCLLCFEREPHACHRSILADMMGAKVCHL